MTLPSCKDLDSAEELGAVLILGIFLIAIFLVFAGIAIDAGNLYASQLRLQKAADAGALAGIGYSIIRSGEPEVSIDGATIEARGQEVAATNLRYARLDSSDIAAEFDENSQELKITARSPVTSLLIHIVPWSLFGLEQFADSFSLLAVSRARRDRANVSLLLDFSGSMLCPASSAKCACLGNSTLAPGETLEQHCRAVAGSSRLKIDDLRDAVAVFLGMFDESRDRVGLVTFNIAAQISAAVGASFSQIHSGLQSVAPRSDTNIADAFHQARISFATAGVPAAENKSYVLFSDGAPTAATLSLVSPQPGLPESPPGSGGYVYNDFSVRFHENGNIWTQPSPLVDPVLVPVGYESPDPPLGSTPPCSPPQADALGYAVFANCLYNFGFFIQGDPLRRPFAAEYGTAEKNWDAWREQYYNAAIIDADYARSVGGNVFSIGLGTPGPVTPDPYQNVADSTSLKDVFLARTANDAQYLERCSTGEPLEKFTFGGVDTFNEVNADATRYGKYFATASSEDLKVLFRLIGQRILLRLLQ